MLRVVPVVFCLLCATAAFANDPLFQTSFQNHAKDWTVVRGSATLDASMPHEKNASLRVERDGAATNSAAAEEDACIRLAPVTLVMGKRYELSGWIRTEALEVRDTDRSPIAVGAALTMASMPFDVHSASLGGTQPWTRVTLDFIASQAHDAILLTVGNGGSFSGKTWFEGIRLEETGAQGEWPAREAVQTFGPAYRYPAAGWIYLHIEGKPYERGYQHGHLMAKEIPEYFERCAASLGDKEHWHDYRTTVNALFLRGFDQEIMEEMRGIADGASDAGARWEGRRIDLVDVAVANTTVELGELSGAVASTATGLEGLMLDKPPYAEGGRDRVTDHCSAFAATGPATRDGKMVIGHVTWWPLTLAEQTNVMLDIQPTTGHRMLIQSYPGGIESGTDWYQNDAGIVLTETTIEQTPFNAEGTPVAFRARQAIQYSSNIDDVVKYLGTRNNGLYTNEWIMGDAKTNEIAIYDLGTKHTRLWRSSKNEWFGDTPGFYWGDNNAKDLDVRKEDYPDPQQSAGFIPYVPGPRDLAWQQLYHKYRGQIDEQFGFLAFRTAPLVSSSTMDAKVVTTDMASHLMVWAAIGKPNQREWLPRKWDSAKDDGLYPSGYYLFTQEPSATLRASIEQNEKDRRVAMAKAPRSSSSGEADSPGDLIDVSATTSVSARPASYEGRLWKGWLLPATEKDSWFVAGSATYRALLESPNFDEALNRQRAAWRRLELAPVTPASDFQRERVRGVLYLDSLRRKMGDDAFLKLMNDYYSVNTTKTVTAQSFLEMAGVEKAGLVNVSAKIDAFDPMPEGPAYVASDLYRQLSSTVIVYGTERDAGANRYVAEQMQTHFLDSYESRTAIYKDFEVTDDLLRHHDVVFVGRPEANSALARWAEQIGLDYQGASFRIDGKVHASEREGLILAAKNPLDATHMVVVVAGNDALSTVKTEKMDFAQDQYSIFKDGGERVNGFLHTTNNSTVARGTGGSN